MSNSLTFCGQAIRINLLLDCQEARNAGVETLLCELLIVPLPLALLQVKRVEVRPVLYVRAKS
jgi:hypothetical protein